MIFKNYECLNNISETLKPRSITVIERASGCSGDAWVENQLWFESVQEAQNECSEFLAKEEALQETDSHVRYELRMEFGF